MFLTADQLQQLTGRERASAQIKWLHAHGYRCDVNALGAPVVLLAEVERHLLGIERKRAKGPDMSQVA